MRESCPICSQKLVMPAGPPDSPVIIIGEFPGHFEILQGWPFAGPSGDILRTELDRVGIRLNKCRQTNLWLHGIPPAKQGKTENPAYAAEAKMHSDAMLEELVHKSRKVALLMGSDVAKYFGYGKVSDVTGLEVKSDFIPKRIRALACYNPAIAEYGTVGEIRLAIERLASLTEGIWNE